MYLWHLFTFAAAVVLCLCVSSKHANAACHHGTIGASGCVCSAGWKGNECSSVDPAITSCKKWKVLLGNDASDGEFIIHTQSQQPFVVWCYGMKTSSPTEFISLPTGPSYNFALNYEQQIPKQSYVPCQLDVLDWANGGRTSFSKLRINPQTMEVDLEDFTFSTSSSPDVQLRFGSAGDCVGNGVKKCPAKGRGHIDLTQTPFSFASSITSSSWHVVGDERSAAPHVYISSSRKTADIICGGGIQCGGCELSSLVLVMDGSEECSPNPCLNDGVCVPGEGGHACYCSGAFEGEDCASPCETSSCQDEEPCVCENGGTCGADTNVCYCPTGWTGSECQEYDYCQVVANANGGEACLEDGECHNLVFDVVETPSGPCVFPFLFKGRQWDTCVEEDGEAPWCSLTKDYDTDKERDECLIHASKPYIKPDATPSPPPPPSPPSSGAISQCELASEGDSMLLTCENDDGKDLIISEISFASYGHPIGSCDAEFAQGDCDGHSTFDVVESRCLGEKSCYLTATDALFSSSCTSTKSLAVSYKCDFEVSGEWVHISMEELVNDLSHTTKKSAGCGTTKPAISVVDSVGITVSSFPTCTDNPGFVGVSFTTPFSFTQIKGSFSAEGTISDVTDCSNSNRCTASVRTNNPPPGVFFLVGQELIKQGGEWDGLSSATFSFDTTGLSVGSNKLVFVVASPSDTTAFTIKDIHFDVFQPRQGEFSDLVGEYLFDAPLHTADGSLTPSNGIGPVGTCGLCPSWEASGLSGGSLVFSSENEFITLEDSLVLALDKDFSIALWVKVNFANCDGFFCDDEPLVCTSASGVSDILCVFIDGDTHFPVMQTRKWSSRGPVRVSEGVWTHLVFSISDSTATIWVDGVHSEIPYILPFAQKASVFVGKHSIGDRFYTGHMDSLLFFDRALTMSEVEKLAGEEPSILPATMFTFESGFNSEYGLATADCKVLTCPKRVSGGIEGMGALFTPNSCLVIKDTTALDVALDESFSFSAWVNPSTTSSVLPMFEYKDEDNTANAVLFSINAGKAVFRIGTVGFYHTDFIFPHVWSLVTLRVTQSAFTDVTIFVNGTGILRRVPSTLSFPSLGAVRVGCLYADGVTTSFIGRMDNVAFYNHPLDEKDVHKLSLEYLPRGISSGSVSCDFDESMCTWNTDNTNNFHNYIDTFVRWNGIARGVGPRPLRDWTLSDLNYIRRSCSNGHTYMYVDMESKISWERAKEFATYFGGHLAELKDVSSQQCATATTTRPVFVGASFDRKGQKKWKWLDGSDVEGFTNFGSNGDLSAPPSDYLVMNAPSDNKGEWSSCDGVCAYVRGFVMEFDERVGDVYESDFASSQENWSASSQRTPAVVPSCGAFPPLLGVSQEDTLTLQLDGLSSNPLLLDMVVVVANQWDKNDKVSVLINNKEVWSWTPSEFAAPIVRNVSGCYIGEKRWNTLKAREVTVELLSFDASEAVLSVTGTKSFGIGSVRITSEVFGEGKQCREGEDEPCYVYANSTTAIATPFLYTPPISPPSNKDTCRVKFWYNMRGERWNSAKSCAELEWRFVVENGVRGDICASSVIDESCYDLTPYEEAASICLSVGARLCTLDELEGDEGKITGCADDDTLIWTSTKCGEERVFVSDGSGEASGTKCLSIQQPSGKVRCCADQSIDNSPARLDLKMQRVDSNTPEIIWSAAGGGSGWVQASVSLPFDGSYPSPYSLSFEAVHSSSEKETVVVGIDEIVLEGCEPVDESADDEFEEFPLVDDGAIKFGLTVGEWLHIQDAVTPKGHIATLYAANDDYNDKVASNASPSQYVEVSGKDFNFVVQQKHGINEFETTLLLTGGTLDGHVIIDSSATITFNGPLFGSSNTTLSVSSLPSTFTLDLQRKGDSLAVLLNNKLQHSFHIGTVSLHHVGVSVQKDASILSAALLVAVNNEDDTPVNDVKRFSIPIVDAFDDLLENPDGRVSVHDLYLPLAHSTDNSSSSDTRTIIGLRFQNVPLSRDDTVTNAYIQFTAAKTSGNGHSVLVISSEYATTSTPFDSITHGAPRKEHNDRLVFLSSLFTSPAACAFIGGSYNGGARRDVNLRLMNYFDENGHYQTESVPKFHQVITYLECKMGNGVADNALSARKKTKTSISWSPSVWDVLDTEEEEQTPNIAAILNEIIANEEWEAENAITVFLSGHSDTLAARTAYALEGASSRDQSFVATLVVEYSEAQTTEETYEGICHFPFTYNHKTYYKCTEDANPLNPQSSYSRPWCGTAVVATAHDFGFCSSHVVKTYGGNANTATHTASCAFPFVFKGKTYTDCITSAASGRSGDNPWCSTTVDYDNDGLWGFCELPTYGGTAGGEPCVFPFYLSGRKYTECTTDGGRGDNDRPWCFTEETDESNLGLSKWGYCSDGSEDVQSWGYECDCPAGRYGHRCDLVCSEGFYGSNCLSQCNCQNGADCDPTTGVCDCLPGWGGADCGTHANTTFSCSSCVFQDPNTPCKDSDGHCTCAPGWALPHCVEECAEGFFGKNCQQQCQCENEGLCDSVDGSCECPPGYSSASNCAEPCKEGYFGEDCIQHCSCENGACDNVDGSCHCPPDYTGIRCEVEPLEKHVFVNEIHYNSVGDDNNEAVEIAGHAGVDLSGYVLAIYSGALGVGTHKKNVLFQGVDGKNIIPDMSNGFGVVVMQLEKDTLENGGGSGDGFALIDSNGKVQQFLSWQGSFEAADGPAKNFRSQNIHVWEPSHTSPSFSLQLLGRGNVYSDFGWAGPKPSSFGQFNQLQTFVPEDEPSLLSLPFVVRVGGTLSNRAISKLLHRNDFTDDVQEQIDDNLYTLIHPATVENLYIVQAYDHGIAVYFTVDGESLPEPTSIIRRLSSMRVIEFGFASLRIDDIEGSDVCSAGTIRDDETESCVPDSSLVSTTTTTKTSTSTSTHNHHSSSRSGSVHSSSTAATTTAGTHSTTVDTSSSTKNKNSTTYMLLGVIGAVIVLAAIVYGVAHHVKRRGKQYFQVFQNDTFEGDDSDVDGDDDDDNALFEEEIERGEPQSNSNILIGNNTMSSLEPPEFEEEGDDELLDLNN
eukprot:m.3989 g.3989  ORF g.3989 m.3989 type:complete len:3037 (-) comp3783_c0_seq1:271-9381(-)